MAKYPAVFKRIPIDNDKEGLLIQKVQDEFENFWRDLVKRCPSNSERTMAMRKMQEACMWLTRSIAINGFVSHDTDVRENHENGIKRVKGDRNQGSNTQPKVTVLSAAEGAKTKVMIKKKKAYQDKN